MPGGEITADRAQIKSGIGEIGVGGGEVGERLANRRIAIVQIDGKDYRAIAAGAGAREAEDQLLTQVGNIGQRD